MQALFHIAVVLALRISSLIFCLQLAVNQPPVDPAFFIGKRFRVLQEIDRATLEIFTKMLDHIIGDLLITAL